MHLRLCAITAPLECNENRHPEIIMRDLGIKYKKALPQSMFDQWVFFDCENIPDSLPKYLSIIDVDPIDFIGHGLSENEAIELSKKEA